MVPTQGISSVLTLASSGKSLKYIRGIRMGDIRMVATSLNAEHPIIPNKSCIVEINEVKYINLAYEAFIKLDIINSVYIEYNNPPFLDNYIIRLNDGNKITITKTNGMNMIADIIKELEES